ncbi:MAG: protein-disulfide reductase DsbD family protein [Alphaproteobacteria bacterium]|jgi:suppressor for copper-sensitivity B|nr:hypothetical protein [Rhodospirillaceae bacterium]MDP6403640.1 protein-disulfide reductase DsbD family protein [Alphaproteobacteria bacterium]MDP6623228.1 protein-disulfide reductase DsbD family protein [Alphaproteobacteria bacterium]|tara:strand:- start:598 stop:1449 length:852 start_codon:yes stop_codon:yes gene_type:complete
MRQCNIGMAALLGLALLPVGGGAAQAKATPWISVEMAQIRMLSAQAAVAGRNTLDLGFQIRLEAGWKTYWRSPGAAGIPLRVSWTGSENVARAELRWPAPKRFSQGGIDSFGYADEVVLPIRIEIAQLDAGLRLQAQVSYAVCREICVPLEAKLALDLPANAGGETADRASEFHRRLIERFQARIPGDSGLEIEGAELLVGKPVVLAVTVRSPVPLKNPDLIVEGPPEYAFGRPIYERLTASKGILRLPIEPDLGAPPYAGGRLTLTLIDDSRALEKSLSVGR